MILDIIRYILSGLLVVVGVLMLRYITDILVYYFGADIVVLVAVLVFMVCFVWLCYKVDNE